jgi:hypothetical protein
MTTPEERAREIIDAKLAESGWIVHLQNKVARDPQSNVQSVNKRSLVNATTS